MCKLHGLKPDPVVCQPVYGHRIEKLPDIVRGPVEQRFGEHFEIERIAGTEQPDFSKLIAGTATYLMTRKG